jgi:RNA polymerase sigma-70 factor (ECF subfamily)
MDTSARLQVAAGNRKEEFPVPILGAGIAGCHTTASLRSAADRRGGVGTPAGERCGSGFGCDPETIRRAQLGDALAWETLVRQNVGWVFSICCRWAGSCSLAEDLTQDVFVKLFQNLHSYRGDLTGFRTWLGRITRNLLIDYYRTNGKERRTVSYDSSDDHTKNILSSIPSKEFNPEARTEIQERRDALRAMFRMLGPELREAVILRDECGLTYAEISKLLNIPVGTVKSRVSRGRIKLAHLMRRHPELWPGFSLRDSAVA